MQSSKKSKLVIFDLDGTIVDSLEANYGLFKTVFEQFSLDVPSRNEFRQMFDKNFYISLKNKVGKKTYDKMIPPFKKIYDDKYNAPAFKGMTHLVNSLPNTAIISSNFEKAIKRALKSNHIRTGKILGADKETSKVKKIKSCKAKAILVSDSIGDILEGKKAGVKTVGVTWGYSKNIKKGKPNYIVNSVSELNKCLKTITKY